MVRTMLRFATTIDVPDGAIDTCGTGGDRAGTINVSTIAVMIGRAVDSLTTYGTLTS